MTYEEGLSLIGKYKSNLDILSTGHKIEHAIISTSENKSEVISEYLGNGFDNKGALIKFGLIDNKDLEIYLYPNKNIGVAVYAEFKSYLKKKGIDI